MPGVYAYRSILSMPCLVLSGLVLSGLVLSGLLLPGLVNGAAAAAPDSSGSPAGADAGNMPVRPTPPQPPIAYICDDGTKITARFPDSSLAMLIVGDDRYELTSVIAASGVRYTGGSVEFWTHQGKARFTRKDKATECSQANAESPGAAPGQQTDPTGKISN